MEAEDLHQQGWMRTFDKIHLYNEAGSLEGWLTRLFIRVCLNAYQKRRRRMQWMEQLPDEQMPDQPVSLSAPDFLAQEQLVAAIAALPEGARLVFNLFAVEGYTHLEIAQELSISEANSRQQLLRARTALAKRIRPTPAHHPASMSRAIILACLFFIIHYSSSLQYLNGVAIKVNSRFPLRSSQQNLCGVATKGISRGLHPTESPTEVLSRACPPMAVSDETEQARFAAFRTSLLLLFIIPACQQAGRD